jgi:hypothetical protein
MLNLNLNPDTGSKPCLLSHFSAHLFITNAKVYSTNYSTFQMHFMVFTYTSSTYYKMKVKVKLSLWFLTEHHAMKAYWGSGGIAPRILELDTRWRWVVSFTPRPLYPRKRAPDTYWIGSWVGPRAGLDAVVKRKVPSPWTPDHPARSPVLYHWAIPAPIRKGYMDIIRKKARDNMDNTMPHALDELSA